MCALSTNRAPVSSAGPSPGSPSSASARMAAPGCRPLRSRPSTNADFVVGGARHLALAGPLAGRNRHLVEPDRRNLPAHPGARGRRVCVLATGDPFHYGVGAELAKLVPPDEMTCFPQPSAFSLAAARLGWSLPDCACVSLHGRALERVIPHLQPGARILALSWDGTTPERLADLLRERGFGASYDDDSRGHGRPARGDQARRRPTGSICPDVDPLNVVAIAVSAAPRCPHRPARARPRRTPGSRMTGSSPRPISARSPSRRWHPALGELLWDVGAGAGSIAIEWMLRHPATGPSPSSRIPTGQSASCATPAISACPTSRSCTGEAPDALRDLPRPDAVFIGGGRLAGRRVRGLLGRTEAGRAAGRQRGDAGDRAGHPRVACQPWRIAQAHCPLASRTGGIAARLARRDAGHAMGRW